MDGCDLFAGDGFCTSSVDLMTTFCKKTCGLGSKIGGITFIFKINEEWRNVTNLFYSLYSSEKVCVDSIQIAFSGLLVANALLVQTLW